MKALHRRPARALIALAAAAATILSAGPAQALAGGTLYDYDGDGRADVSVDRLATSSFYWPGGGRGSVGAPFAVPVPGQWFSTGSPTDKTDPATFADGTWSIAGALPFGFGRAGDLPVAGDWNDDGYTVEPAVFRPTTGEWFLQSFGSFGFGRRGDLPFVMTQDGTRAGVYRPSTGQWFVRGLGAPVAFGRAGDVPVPADYDKDGVTDIAVFRPSTGQWFIRGQAPVGFGRFGDLPVAADYDGDGDADIAVWRGETSTWFVRGILTRQFGKPITPTGDVVDLPARNDLLTILY